MSHQKAHAKCVTKTDREFEAPRFIRNFTLALCLALLVPLAAAQDRPEEGTPAEPEAAATTVENPSIEGDELLLRLLPLSKKEIATEAGGWFELLQGKMQELAEAKIAARTAEGDAATKLQEQIEKLSDERKGYTSNYSLVVDAWERKGADPKAITEYRAYRQAIALDELKATDPATLFSSFLDWLGSADGGVALLLSIATIVVAFLVLLVVARVVRRMARRWLNRIPDISSLLQAFLVVIIYWLTLVIGIMLVLSLLGVDVTPLFAVIGGASFIVAFALQETLGNLASGLLIMITKPFDVGDTVNVAGTTGTVETMNVVSTTFNTLDNQATVIPNNMIVRGVITNIFALPIRRVDLIFGISYGDSIETAIKVMDETVKNHPMVLDEPAPVIAVCELGDSSVNFHCRPWVKSGNYWPAYWDITRQVKEKFDAAGISIPFPQRDVHHHGLTQLGPAVSPQSRQP